MKINRRNFINTVTLFGLGSSFPFNLSNSTKVKHNETSYSQFDEILAKPVLKKELFTNQVIIDPHFH